MPRKSESREAQREQTRREQYLYERGWFRRDREPEFRHRNLTFGWPLDAALRLEAEADIDTKFAEMIHGILRGVY